MYIYAISIQLKQDINLISEKPSVSYNIHWLSPLLPEYKVLL